jgi:excisionase family DNA binding protein
MGPLLLSVADAAHMIGVSRSKLYELLASNEIPSVRIGSRRLVAVATLQAWVAEQLAASAGERGL